MPARHQSIFTGRMLFLMVIQHCQITEGNSMFICLPVNTGFKPHGCEHYSTNCCYL